MNPDQHKWDAVYSAKPSHTLQVADVLIQNQHLLPQQGNALDLACGLGANALFLAKRNFNVTAWDISSVAIEKLKVMASQQNVEVLAEVRDVLIDVLPQSRFDVIVVTHFLDRNLCADLVNALRQGGLLFYQTYCRDKVSDIGPRNPDYLLADNELLSLFNTLKLRVYREESYLGELKLGWRNQAMLVAEKC